MMNSNFLEGIGLLTIAIIPAIAINNLGPETGSLVKCFLLTVELGAIARGGYLLREYLRDENRRRRK